MKGCAAFCRCRNLAASYNHNKTVGGVFMTKEMNPEQKTAGYPQSDVLREAVRIVSEINSQSGITQGTYAVEECSELTKELMKLHRGKGNYSKRL